MGKFNFNLLIFILVILVIIIQVRSCLTESITSHTQTSVVVQALSSESGDDLDLEALGALLNRAQNAEELEQLLNQKEGINNLDINNDGVVDFVSVTEFGSGNERGFSLSTEIASGVETEIATIRVKQDTQQQAQVQVQGNETLYGSNTYYNSRVGLSNVLLFAWLFSPHRPYYSPFAWGYYPPYYGGGYGTVSQNQYRTRTSAVKNSKSASLQKSSKPQFQPKTTSPKAAASTTSRQRSLNNPTRSQRSFSNSTSSIRRSSRQYSGSSFGGGK